MTSLIPAVSTHSFPAGNSFINFRANFFNVSFDLLKTNATYLQSFKVWT